MECLCMQGFMKQNSAICSLIVCVYEAKEAQEPEGAEKSIEAQDAKKAHAGKESPKTQNCDIYCPCMPAEAK